jgi:hypothetical protein
MPNTQSHSNPGGIPDLATSDDTAFNEAACYSALPSGGVKAARTLAVAGNIVGKTGSQSGNAETRANFKGDAFWQRHGVISGHDELGGSAIGPAGLGFENPNPLPDALRVNGFSPTLSISPASS